MKKSYETPSVEVVKFQYSDQVVARSVGCDVQVTHADTEGLKKCTSGGGHEFQHD
jgi:hypothetical protein